MNYQELYQQKLTTAEEAVKVVKSGDWVDYSWCCNYPVSLDKALAARKDELYDVKIRGGVTMWMPEVCKAEDAGEHFTWNSWHCSGIDRKIIGKGMGFFGPLRYSELPRFYRDGNVQVDVAMLQVTPMDAHGNFSFALSASHLADMLDRAKVVIVEVNRNMPWVYGLTGSEINIKDVDMVVEGENPAIAAMGAGAPPTEVDRKVAEMIVRADSRRRLPPAGYRRDAQHCGLPDCRVRPEGSGRPYRDVCGRLCGHGPGRQTHRPVQESGQGPSGVRLRRRFPETL